MSDGRLPLNRALSKLGVLSRAQATEAIRAGRVTVDGVVIREPRHAVAPERAVIRVDGERAARTRWRTLAFHKPRGVVTTRRDPDGRPTIYDLLGAAARGLIPVGRLDLATSGLLLLTNDTRLANAITDPHSGVPRVYVVTVRGRLDRAAADRLTSGIGDRGEMLRAARVSIRKASGRETHLILELREGKNREVRRLLAAVGHEVTRLARISIGGIELGRLAPGEWHEVSRAEVARAFRQGR
jgi:23S rRNA pseudouridine2605 synthase